MYQTPRLRDRLLNWFDHRYDVPSLYLGIVYTVVVLWLVGWCPRG